MKLLGCALSLLFVLSSYVLAQSNTTFYANTSTRFGFLTGWETRASSVLFTDIGPLPYSTGGIAVSGDRAYGVAFLPDSFFYSFDLNDPTQYVEYDISGASLDALVTIPRTI